MDQVKTWDGKKLKGLWLVTLRVSGVHVSIDRWGNATSKGSLVSGLGKLPKSIDEVVVRETSLKESSILFTPPGKRAKHIDLRNVFALEPYPDPRLVVKHVENPSAKTIKRLLYEAVRDGYDGLILRKDAERILV